MTRLLTFEALRYANVQRNKEWDPDGQITAVFRGLELAGEIGELCNMIKKLERERMGLLGSRVGLIDLAYEMGDCQVCLDQLAMHYSVDLDITVKHIFNRKSEEQGFLTRID